MRKQESVRVMAFGMEAYRSAFQVHTVLNSFHFRSGIYCMYHMEYVRFVHIHAPYPANPKPTCYTAIN